MNPRFPTSSRYRRHQKQPSLLRFVPFGVVVLAGLFFWLYNKTPEPSTRVEQPENPVAKVAPTVATTPPASKLEVKVELKPVGPPGTNTEASLETKTEREPEAKIISEQKSEQKLDIVEIPKPEVPSLPSPFQKVAKGLSIKIDPPQTSVPITSHAEDDTIPPLPMALAPKPRKPDLDLTFYKELPKKQLILLGELKEKIAVPLPLANHMDPQDVAEKLETTAIQEGRPFAQEVAVRPAQVVVARPAQVVAVQSVQDGATPKVAAQKSALAQRPISVGKVGFMVQVASFPESRSAVKLADQLRRRGGNPKVALAKDALGASFFHVRMGPFSSYDKAMEAVRHWRVPNHSAVVVPMDG